MASWIKKKDYEGLSVSYLEGQPGVILVQFDKDRSAELGDLVKRIIPYDNKPACAIIDCSNLFRMEEMGNVIAGLHQRGDGIKNVYVVSDESGLIQGYDRMGWCQLLNKPIYQTVDEALQTYISGTK